MNGHLIYLIRLSEERRLEMVEGGRARGLDPCSDYRETQGERFRGRGRVFVRPELNTCAKEECSLAFLLVYQLAEKGREGA